MVARKGFTAGFQEEWVKQICKFFGSWMIRGNVRLRLTRLLLDGGYALSALTPTSSWAGLPPGDLFAFYSLFAFCSLFIGTVCAMWVTRV
jgi:hypothetical protein